MIKVNAKELNDAVEYVRFCMSKDTSRPLLNDVHFKQKDTRLLVEACDGYRLSQATIKIISTDQCVALEALVKPFPITVDALGVFEISLEVDGRYLVVSEQNGEKHSHIRMMGDYLNTEKVLPTDDPMLVVCINPKYLGDIAKQFKKKSDMRNGVIMEFHGPIGAVIVHKRGDPDKVHMLLPLRQ